MKRKTSGEGQAAMTIPLRQALSAPLGFPGLSQIVFPGDRVLLAPDDEFARLPEILDGIVAALLENGLSIEDLAVLMPDSSTRTLESGVRVIVHQPARRGQLALLGVNEADEPIVLNRELVDADFVITVARYHLKKKPGCFGLHSAIFPRFSDQQTQHRFASTAGRARKRLEAEVDDVAKRLGIVFTIQFLAESGQSDRVAAGLPEKVDEHFRKV